MGKMEIDNTNFTDDDDSDRELQIAFEKGLLKPGLNQEVERRKFTPINNITGLNKKLKEIELALPWVETLDLTCEPAPLAPELALQLESHKKKSSESNHDEDDLIYNDFAREMLFYRLGQAAVLRAIPKLNKLEIPSKRPEDYFAEMSKSDEHMHKVRQKLKVKENALLIREKARKLRDLKKHGKKVQIQKHLQRQEEKRTILEQLKKYRKGKTNSLDFLDEGPDKTDSSGIIKSKNQLKMELREIKDRRKQKDKKYGLKGKKKGWKKNTAKDLDGPLDSVGRKINHRFRGNPKQQNKRLGKSTRHQMKQNKNKKKNKH